jgi:micrococcal nuclease
MMPQSRLKISLIALVVLFLPVLVLAAGKFDQKLVNKFKGRILLQVQGHGEAWYLNPVDGKRYYLKDGAAAYELMRKFGQGISDGDLEKIPVGILDILVTEEKSKIETKQTEAQQQNSPTTPTKQQESQAQQTQSIISKEDPQVTFYTVTRVIDGDTIDVSLNGTIQRIRTIGMDTPEVVDPRKPVQCFGKESSSKASELLLNKKVRLESDPTQGDKDIYARLLRYVYREDGLFFNKAMIEEGYAHEYTYAIPYKFQSDFKAVQQTAKEKQLGLWSPTACITTIVPEPSQSASSTNTTPVATQPESQSESLKAVQKSDGHTWYTSSHHTARFYYCDTDLQWQGLSKNNLQTFLSEAGLLQKYQRTLHESCK